LEGVLLLVTGASGVGKSSVRTALEPRLPGVRCAGLSACRS
jgi:guanylate kinase